MTMMSTSGSFRRLSRLIPLTKTIICTSRSSTGCVGSKYTPLGSNLHGTATPLRWNNLSCALSARLLNTHASLHQKHGNHDNSPNTTEPSGSQLADQPTGDDQSVGIFARFKNAYKEHGKVLIGVHLVTSSVWITAFYYAAASGLDITPLLSKIGVSDKIIQYVNSSVGNLATAYVLYKLATPARYTATVFGTYSSVKYLRKWGYMEAPRDGDTIRELVKDGRIQMKEKYSDIKDDVKDKYSDIKDDVKDKYGEMKVDVKDKLKDKVESMKDQQKKS